MFIEVSQQIQPSRLLYRIEYASETESHEDCTQSKARYRVIPDEEDVLRKCENYFVTGKTASKEDKKQDEAVIPKRSFSKRKRMTR